MDLGAYLVGWIGGWALSSWPPPRGRSHMDPSTIACACRPHLASCVCSPAIACTRARIKICHAYGGQRKPADALDCSRCFRDRLHTSAGMGWASRQVT